jgi:hypothetical protein
MFFFFFLILIYETIPNDAHFEIFRIIQKRAGHVEIDK